LQGAGTEMVARVGRDCALHAGDTFDLGLDVAALHIFDPGTTKMLGSTGSGNKRTGSRP